MSKEIKYTDVVPNSIVTRYKEDNIQYLLDQVARLTAENAMLKEKWSTPKQPEQEPVAWKVIDGTNGNYMFSRIKPTERSYKYDVVIPLYTALPKREPLSDEQVYSIGNKYAFHAAVREIERIHGIGGGE